MRYSLALKCFAPEVADWIDRLYDIHTTLHFAHQAILNRLQKHSTPEEVETYRRILNRSLSKMIKNLELYGDIVDFGARIGTVCALGRANREDLAREILGDRQYQEMQEAVKHYEMILGEKESATSH